jgi:hypothetical protein
MGTERFDQMKATPTYAEDLVSSDEKVLKRAKSALDRYKGDAVQPWKYDYAKHGSMIRTFLKSTVTEFIKSNKGRLEAASSAIAFIKLLRKCNTMPESVSTRDRDSVSKTMETLRSLMLPNDHCPELPKDVATALMAPRNDGNGLEQALRYLQRQRTDGVSSSNVSETVSFVVRMVKCDGMTDGDINTKAGYQLQVDQGNEHRESAMSLIVGCIFQAEEMNDVKANNLNEEVFGMLDYTLARECEHKSPGHNAAKEAFFSRASSSAKGHGFEILLNLLRSVNKEPSGQYPKGLRHYPQSQYAAVVNVKLNILRLINKLCGIGLIEKYLGTGDLVISKAETRSVVDELDEGGISAIFQGLIQVANHVHIW